MKTTFYIKSIDLLLQIAAILVPFVIGLLRDELPFYLLIAFFLIGAFQVVSALLNNILLDKFLRSSWRRYYNIGLPIIAIGVFAINIMHLQGIENIVAPYYLVCILMAIAYCHITIAEVKYIASIIRRQQYTRI